MQFGIIEPGLFRSDAPRLQVGPSPSLKTGGGRARISRRVLRAVCAPDGVQAELDYLMAKAKPRTILYLSPDVPTAAIRRAAAGKPRPPADLVGGGLVLDGLDSGGGGAGGGAGGGGGGSGGSGGGGGGGPPRIPSGGGVPGGGGGVPGGGGGGAAVGCELRHIGLEGAGGWREASGWKPVTDELMKEALQVAPPSRPTAAIDPRLTVALTITQHSSYSCTFAAGNARRFELPGGGDVRVRAPPDRGGGRLPPPAAVLVGELLQRQCLSREGSGNTGQRRCLSRRCTR